MGSTYFRSYEGRKPYMFISYAHLDSERVVPLLSALKYAPSGMAAREAATAGDVPASTRKREARACYRIWYDEGIDAGSEWPENIERHMQGSALTLVFWSAASAMSKNCYREMVNANRSGRPVLFVLLDQTPLPREHAGNTGMTLDGDGAPTEALLRLILASGFLPEDLIGADYPAPPRPPWLLIAGLAAVFAAVVGGAVFLTRQRPEMQTTPVVAVQTPGVTIAPTAAPVQEKALAVFSNPVVAQYVYETLQRFDLMPLTIQDRVLRQAVYARLQLPEDAENPDARALSGIRELHICGDMIANSREDIQMVNGAYFVDGKKAGRGKLRFRSMQETDSDYLVIACMSGLKSLTLSYQAEDDGIGMESLATLPELEYLDISGNAIQADSFSYLWENRKLAELNLAHTDVTTIIALNSLPRMQKVYISRDMLPDMFHTFDSRIRFDVILID